MTAPEIDGSEIGLLVAVRDAIRAIDGWTSENCQIEFDDFVPPTAGNRFCAVLPRGFTPGPSHKPSGGVKDYLLGVEVWVVKRTTAKPASKRRDLYLDEATGLNSLVTPILNGVDFIYSVSREAARQALLLEGYEEDDITDTLLIERGFTHPLVFQGLSPRPEVVNGDQFFAQSTEPRAGIARRIFLGGARRMKAR